MLALLSVSTGLNVPLVKSHLSRSLLTLDVEDSLRDAARLLRVAQITGAPVVMDGSLAGILSRNDLLRKIAELDGTREDEAFERSLKSVQENEVYDVMEQKPTTILPTATLVDAAQVMATKKLNRLMVKANFGAMLGIISSTDVVFAMLDIDQQKSREMDTTPYQFKSSEAGEELCDIDECSLSSMVRDYMATRLIVAKPSMPLEEAGLLLRAARVTGAPVVEDGKLVGVLSRNDLLKALHQNTCDIDECGVDSLSGEAYEAAIKRIKQIPVSEVMSSSPITIKSDTSVLDCAKIMAKDKLNRLIVTSEGGDLTGVISSTDVCFAMLGCKFGAGEDDDQELINAIDWSKRTGNLYRRGIY